MNKIWLLLFILVIFSSCSRKTEEQLYTEAQGAETAKNFTQAIACDSEIVARFPAGKHAEESQYRLALLYNNELHDIPRALAAYQLFYKQFPNSPNAPSALFLTGFLFNNELHNIDSAKIAYQAFLQQYPTNELAHSAQFELDNLGKDPTAVFHNDILTKAAEKDSIEALSQKKPAKKMAKKAAK